VNDQLLGGARRKRTRKRGFADWRPDASSRALLTQVQAVLAEYSTHLPLTIRQIFYRLVGVHGYAKTERAYKRLCRHLNDARRAQLVPMDDIRDDGGTIYEIEAWEDADAFIDDCVDRAAGFRLDRTVGQPSRLVVVCEAAGMAPQLARVANPYGIKVMSGGGFDSLTDKHNFANEIADEERPVEVLHIGDHDASGLNMYLALLEDTEAFCEDIGGEVTFTRLAVTPAQVQRYRLPTGEPKRKDKRAYGFDWTCQAEALAPDVLAAILKSAITTRLNERAYKRVLSDERKAREELMARLGAP
jgi:hypothetical protein